MTATWYAVRGSNDHYWRVQVPARAIGADVRFIPLDEGQRILAEPNLHSAFPWHVTDDGADYPAHEGVAVFTRPDQVRAAHALEMKQCGRAPRIVAEVDDDYTSAESLGRIADGSGQRLTLYRVDEAQARVSQMKAFLAFDALIVTTKRLADVYRKAFRKLGGKQDIHVCGNHVDPDDWPDPKPESNRLRVGWMGSASHALDVGLAYAALRWAHDAGHEVVMVGYDPHWQPEDEMAGRYASAQRVRGYSFRYTQVPWKDPRDNDRSREAWPLDIAVAPLGRTALALGRSDVKAVEYTMSGAACVLANNEVYSDWQHGETCLKAGGPEDYWRAVQRLAGDAALRERLVQAAQQYVREERTIAAHRHEWQEAVHG